MTCGRSLTAEGSWEQVQTVIRFHCLVSGSEESSFLYPPDESKDWSPESPPRRHPLRRPSALARSGGVDRTTQTEGHIAQDTSRPQPTLLAPASLTPCPSPVPTLLAPASLTPCPSPVPTRKQRHFALWENRDSMGTKPKEPDEETKPTCELLENVSFRPLLCPLC